MPVHSGQLRFGTRGNGDIVDLTDGVRSVVRTAAADSGRHRLRDRVDRCVTTMEYEPGGVGPAGAPGPADPAAGDYAHNRLNHDTNAHAHLRAAVIGPSESVPLVAGR